MIEKIIPLPTMEQTRTKLKTTQQIFKTQVLTLGGLLAIMWGLEIIDLFLGGRLNSFGIRPRSIPGLLGIFAAPFLHGNLLHLIGNTLPFLILGGLVILRGIDEFWVVSAIGLLLGGLGTWLFGNANSVHIGASGVIFSYFGFLVMRGYFERSFASMALAILVALTFGGMIWGVLPLKVGISWEGHLFGAIGGAVAAWLFSKLPPENG
jgi:membrane associated rhomboid family serine protease